MSEESFGTDALAAFRMEWREELSRDASGNVVEQESPSPPDGDALDDLGPWSGDPTLVTPLADLTNSPLEFSRTLQPGEEHFSFVDSTKHLRRSLRGFRGAQRWVLPNDDDDDDGDFETFIGDLPDEVILKIYMCLEPKALMISSLVCKQWLHLSCDSELWKSMCMSTWETCRRAEWLRYGMNWHHMWLTRPRLLYSGLFVSKTSYVRPGETEWAYYKPCHVVTYWRMIRLYPNGTCLYTLTFDAPKNALAYMHINLEEDGGEEVVSSKASKGSYEFDDTSGSMSVRILEKKTNRILCFELTMHTRRAGRKTYLEAESYHSLDVGSGRRVDFDADQLRRFQYVPTTLR